MGLDSQSWDGTNSVTVAAGSTATYDNLVDLEALVGEGFITNAVWVFNRKMKATLLKLKDDQKRPIFERAIEDGFVGYLLGYPVRLDANVKDGEAYFGDWKAGYVMNFAQPIEIASSEEAGFMSGSVVYRGMALADGKPTGVKGALARTTCFFLSPVVVSCAPAAMSARITLLGPVSIIPSVAFALRLNGKRIAQQL